VPFSSPPRSPFGRRRAWSRKFADAFRGLARAVRTQSSFAVHLATAVVVVAVGAILRVTRVEWCLLAAAIGGVLTAEIFNTALETLSRAVDTDHHPRIRDALDMASAAVLTASVTAATIGAIVLGTAAWRWCADICALGLPGSY
jgi:diacylglycerol kinase